MHDGGLLTAAEVAGRLRVAKRTVERWTASGVLPAPVRLGKRVVRWRAADIDRFVATAAELTGSKR